MRQQTQTENQKAAAGENVCFTELCQAKPNDEASGLLKHSVCNYIFKCLHPGSFSITKFAIALIMLESAVNSKNL